MAWLNATPKGTKESRLADFRKRRGGEHPSLTMPEVGPGIHIIQWLQEAGFYSSNGMDITPLSWTEMESWIRVTRKKFPVWVPTLIKELSEAYVSEYKQSSDASRPAPYVDFKHIDRDVVDTNIRSFFAGLMRGNKAKG